MLLPCILVSPPHPTPPPCPCRYHHHHTPPKPHPPQGKPENLQVAQEALLKRAKANSDAQLGQYNPANESADAGERTYEKGYKVRVGGWMCCRGFFLEDGVRVPKHSVGCWKVMLLVL